MIYAVSYDKMQHDQVLNMLAHLTPQQQLCANCIIFLQCLLDNMPDVAPVGKRLQIASDIQALLGTCQHYADILCTACTVWVHCWDQYYPALLATELLNQTDTHMTQQLWALTFLWEQYINMRISVNRQTATIEIPVQKHTWQVNLCRKSAKAKQYTVTLVWEWH